MLIAMIIGTIRLVVAVLEVTSVRKMVPLDAATEDRGLGFRESSLLMNLMSASPLLQCTRGVP